MRDSGLRLYFKRILEILAFSLRIGRRHWKGEIAIWNWAVNESGPLIHYLGRISSCVLDLIFTFETQSIW